MKKCNNKLKLIQFFC